MKNWILIGIAVACALILGAQTTTTTPQPAPVCHYEIVGVSGTATFLLNPCTADSWYYDDGFNYSGDNEPATWKRIVKE